MARKIVLASASPRRRELLAALGVPFEVDSADVDETAEERDPARLVKSLALRKARAGAARRPDATVVGSDTVVVLDGRVLGKPDDAEHARAMLRALRARAHEVLTGVALVVDGRASVAHARTVVTMRDYSDADIDAFVATGSPLDKAGAYAFQDERFAPAASVDGCTCSVIGLPLWTLHRLLRAAGIEAAPPALARCAGCPERARSEAAR